jgi:hypothetical protein
MITASTLMRCKALGLADALPEKTYSTTSIAMDWPHKQQRLHLLRQQHLLRHLLLHQLLLQHQLPLRLLRQHLLQHRHHAR